METSSQLRDLLAPLFEALPLERAMPSLGPCSPASASSFVEDLMREPLVRSHPYVEAGLWLYVDDLERSHEISQGLSTPLGSVWHGIMHRREGDFWNSKHWFRQAGSVSALADLNPIAFVDRVSREGHLDDQRESLLEHQRLEWQAVFEWALEGRK